MTGQAGARQMKSLYLFSLVLIPFLLTSCASQQVHECPPGTLQLPDCPSADAVNDESINALFQQRTWIRNLWMWTGLEDGKKIVFYSEPYAGFWKKLAVTLLRVLPVDAML